MAGRGPPGGRNAAANPLDDDPNGVPHPMSKRWVPYRSTRDGTAVYVHQNACPPGECEYVGGEFMVSCIVRGSPEDCLAALTRPRSTTTVLGPAAGVHVLGGGSSSSGGGGGGPTCDGREAGDAQVLHLQLLPPPCGGLGCLCAPRHAVVRQELKQDPCGIKCVLFSSLPDAQARQLLLDDQQRRRRRQQLRRHCRRHHHGHHCPRQPPWIAAVVRACMAVDGVLRGTRSLLLLLLTGGGGGSSGSGGGALAASLWGLGSWLWAPVLLQVAGGFTVSGLQGFAESDSPEALVTCILKVDLGGWLSHDRPGSWLYRPALALGVVDQMVDRLLSAVRLAKDEVEQQRFRSSPFGPLAAPAGEAGPPAAAANGDLARQDSGGGWSCSGSSDDGGEGRRAAAAAGSSCQQGSWWCAVQGLAGDLAALVWGAASAALSPRASAAGGGLGPPSRRQSLLSQGSLVQAAQQLVGVDEATGQLLTGWCDPAFWSELHQPGGPAPFKVRGPHYLQDSGKVAAGPPTYSLIAVDLVTTPAPVQHISRFLPSVRRSRAGSCFVFNLMVPSADSVVNLAITFGSARRWGDFGAAPAPAGAGGAGASGAASGADSGAVDGDGGAGSGRAPFDHCLHRFVRSGDAERSGVLKMIPHIEVGSWLVKQTVGATPFIVGRKLAASYHLGPRYLEVDVDVTTCRTAGFIVQSIRGVTTSMVIDLAFLLEGQQPCELPEALLGAVRFSNLDMAATTPLDTSREVPSWPEPWRGA